MAIEVRILRQGDEDALAAVAPGVFDHSVDARQVREFLGDSRHHMAAAIEDGIVIGFASAVHYVHPDKPAELWINEVAVSPKDRRRGLGKRLLAAILEEGKRLECQEAWVLTDRGNTAATRLYASSGGKNSDQVMFTFELSGGGSPHRAKAGAAETSRITSLAAQFLVDDLQRTIAYYRDRLGFEFDKPWEGFYAIGRRDGLELHFKEAPKNPEERKHRRENEHLDASAGVDGIDALYHQFVTAGAKVYRPLKSTEWGTMDFYIEDPDGYIICFGGQ